MESVLIESAQGSFKRGIDHANSRVRRPLMDFSAEMMALSLDPAESKTEAYKLAFRMFCHMNEATE